MKIIDIKKNDNYLKEYIRICNSEWGRKIEEKSINSYINKKLIKIHNEDKVISILGLIEKETMIGFISLFKYDGNERKDLSPWYATMYIKNEYRGKKYSKLLNDAILKKATNLGYNKVYLKTNLINYYEKFGAIYMENLKNGEKIYYFNLKN